MEHPFFMNPNSNRAEAIRWLSIAEKLLNNRDLVGCKSFATRARDSDPSLVQAEQILAIADTLIAGEKRINNQHIDWYGILQVAPNQSHDSEFIANQYRRLALLLNPQKNTLSFADQAFRLVVDAWSLLSNPFRKSLYDKELGFFLNLNPDPVPSAPNTVSSVQQPSGFNVFPNSSREQQQIFFGSREQQPISSGQSVTFLSRDPVQPVTSMQQPSSSREQQPQPQPQPQPVMFLNRDQQPPVTPVPAANRDPQPPVTFMPSSSREPVQISFGASQRHSEQPPVVVSLQSPATDHQRNKQPQQQTEGSVGNNNHNLSGSSIGNANKETEVEEPKSDIPSFWTACPYCYHMFEYPDAYVDCTLRCRNCKMAFQAIAISSPPPIIDGKEAYFCCWGFLPLGFSVPNWERNRDRATSWSPFSPMFTCPRGGTGNEASGVSANYAAMGQKSGNTSGGFNSVGASKGGASHKSVTPRIYVDDDDDDDDVLVGLSDSGEESDEDWHGEKRKKSKSLKGKGMKTLTPNRSTPKQQADKGKNAKGNTGENSQDGLRIQSGGRLAAESSKKGVVSNTRRQSGRIAKDYGKLDLNVEFSNEVEEHPPGMDGLGNGAVRGEDDNIFFEGLDEFLSSLPILNVVGEDKVKAA
nr:uncharacterized protein LOC109190627 [Ipomoea trifida]